MTPPRVQAIIPFISKSASTDWERDCRYLKQTLQSVFAMSESFIGACVVAHECPPFLKSFKRANWVQAFHDCPDLDSCHAGRIRDKGLKVMQGVQWASSTGADWVMFLDADDLVSRRLEREANLSKFDAIVLLGGYRWNPTLATVQRTFNLNKCCGSSHLVKLDARWFPYWLGGASSGPRMADQSHTEIYNSLNLGGARIQKIRRPLIAYRSGNPNSLTSKVVRSSGFGSGLLSLFKGLGSRAVSQRLIDEYMISG